MQMSGFGDKNNEARLNLSLRQVQGPVQRWRLIKFVTYFTFGRYQS